MSALSKGSAVLGVLGVGSSYFNMFGKEGSAGVMVISASLIGVGSALEMVEGLYSKKK